MRKILFVTTAILGLGLSGAYAQSAQPPKVGQSSLGAILVTTNGMTLYTYTRDMTGFSNCNNQCAAAWPPLLAATDAKGSGDWSVITRDDGNKQWAYKGAALYTWPKDTQPGDTTGENADSGKWHVAKP